jgi:hypothetical protein
MDVEEISQRIIIGIRKERRFDSKIIQEQEKTWLKFLTPVPSNLHKPITTRLKQEGEVIKWISVDEIEIKLS